MKRRIEHQPVEEMKRDRVTDSNYRKNYENDSGRYLEETDGMILDGHGTIRRNLIGGGSWD